MALTVSIAVALCSKVELNWNTTYSPSGAPGNVVLNSDVAISCVSSVPIGVHTALKDFSQSSAETVALNRVDAESQLDLYCPVSVIASHSMVSTLAFSITSDSLAWAENAVKTKSRPVPSERFIT